MPQDLFQDRDGASDRTATTWCTLLHANSVPGNDFFRKEVSFDSGTESRYAWPSNWLVRAAFLVHWLTNTAVAPYTNMRKSRGIIRIIRMSPRGPQWLTSDTGIGESCFPRLYDALK